MHGLSAQTPVHVCIFSRRRRHGSTCIHLHKPRRRGRPRDPGGAENVAGHGCPSPPRGLCFSRPRRLAIQALYAGGPAQVRHRRVAHMTSWCPHVRAPRLQGRTCHLSMPLCKGICYWTSSCLWSSPPPLSRTISRCLGRPLHSSPLTSAFTGHNHSFGHHVAT